MRRFGVVVVEDAILLLVLHRQPNEESKTLSTERNDLEYQTTNCVLIHRTRVVSKVGRASTPVVWFQLFSCGGVGNLSKGLQDSLLVS